MITKSTENPLGSPLQINTTKTNFSNANKGFVFDKVMFDIDSLSALQSLFDPSCQNNSNTKAFTKAASVKFMITIQDEADLLTLGYSKAQIDALKPQEAANIIQAGTKAEVTDVSDIDS